jgi:hypothetical protein
MNEVRIMNKKKRQTCVLKWHGLHETIAINNKKSGIVFGLDKQKFCQSFSIHVCVAYVIRLFPVSMSYDMKLF